MFYIALGATVGILVVRKASQAAKRLTPAGMQSSMTGALGGLGDAIRDFGANVREGMAEREDQLRSELGLDGSHDVVDS
jgi:chromosome condensin MukBEF MukE localization factor